MRRNLRQFIPPVCFTILDRLVRGRGYFGSYPNWAEAQRASSGYDGDLILERVKDSLLKVKSGAAVYERDSVLFDEIQYSWPLLAGLLWVASRNGNRLNIADFGGSLGSSYFQNRQLLGHLDELRWNVIEQEKFVTCGRQFFQDDQLRFYYSLDECAKVQRLDAVLLSSVLPYLEKPYQLLAQVVATGVEYLLIDRTPLLEGNADRLTVQKVPARIYPASYPAWILGRQKLLDFLGPDYDLVGAFDALGGTIALGDAFADDTGFLFQRKAGRVSRDDVAAADGEGA